MKESHHMGRWTWIWKWSDQANWTNDQQQPFQNFLIPYGIVTPHCFIFAIIQLLFKKVQTIPPHSVKCNLLVKMVTQNIKFFLTSLFLSPFSLQYFSSLLPLLSFFHIWIPWIILNVWLLQAKKHTNLSYIHSILEILYLFYFL